MVKWFNATVCKTVIHRFKSDFRLNCRDSSVAERRCEVPSVEGPIPSPGTFHAKNKIEG